jgi:hypothetical protein
LAKPWIIAGKRISTAYGINPVRQASFLQVKEKRQIELKPTQIANRPFRSAVPEDRQILKSRPSGCRVWHILSQID